MNDFEFIEYRPVQNQDNFLGIATVEIYGKFLVSFKVVANKDGEGFFTPDPGFGLKRDDGTYENVKTFIMDSRIEDRKLKEIIRVGVNQALNTNPQQQQPPPQQQQQQVVQPQQQNFAPNLDSCPF